MRTFIRKTKLNELDKFVLVADLKLLNIILGLGIYSSKFPCPYGHCFKNKKGLWVKGIARTLQNILENCQKWRESGAVNDRRKEFYSCEEEPLINPTSGETNTEVLKKFPPPPLHLLLGCANHLWKMHLIPV